MAQFAYKGIAFAYPHSPSAKDFGMSETGCWLVVGFGLYGSVGEDVSAHPTKEEAIAAAEKMDAAIHPTYPGYITQPQQG